MSTSRQTFDQVKGILSKLDRGIDSARAKRLSADAGTVDADDEPRIGRAEEAPEGSSEDVGHVGRARPMQRESLFKRPARDSTDAWPRG